MTQSVCAPLVISFILLISQTASSQDNTKDYNTVNGRISLIKISELGCTIHVQTRSKTYELLGDQKYCYSNKFSKGVFVKAEWKMKKIDNCQGQYGCGKYKDYKHILHMQAKKF